MKTVLLIDDDQEFIEFIKFTLQEQGYFVVGFQDAASALSWLESQKPDLIMLDIKMPDIDGFSFLDQLRYQKLRMSTPVLLMSTEEPVKLRSQYEWTDFISKPIVIGELVSKIDHLLANSRLELSVS